MEDLKQKIEKQMRENYIFSQPCIDKNKNDIFFCTCGEKHIVNSDESSYNFKEDADISFDTLDMDTAYRQMSLQVNLTCHKCGNNYMDKQVSSKIQQLNTDFLDQYETIENDKELKIIKIRAKPVFDADKLEYTINFNESLITILKEEKTTIYKKFNDKETVVKLQNVVNVSKEFFSTNDPVVVIEGFVNLHDFIGRMSRLIVDSKNMNIIEELMGLMIGRTGTVVLQKTLAIFMGIMCYPSLSTIALTKGNVFLYDMLENCPLPDIEYLTESQATSPMKIFNTLIMLKNKDIQHTLDEDDVNNLGYVFKTKSGQEISIKVDKDMMHKIDTAKSFLSYASGGDVFVRDKIDNYKISPIIFNKMKRFADYEMLIRWMKFITYENLVNLVMQYDIELLNAIFLKIEFRDDINWNRIKQFIPLMLSYGQSEKHKSKKAYSSEATKYEFIKYFDFNLYDDCLRMILELSWKPEKVLYKTKDFDKLIELHENLIKFRAYISDDEANAKYIAFSDKYRYCEGIKMNKPEEDDISKWYKFEIKILSTPEQLLNTAVEMHNCAGSYISKVASGQYVPFVLFDDSSTKKPEEFHKYMMILQVTRLGLELVGVKSNCNKYGTDRFKISFMNFLIDHDISFRDVPSIKLGVNSSEHSYAGTFDKLESEPQ